MGPAGKFGNLGELIEKPGKQRGGKGGGVICYDRIKQNVQQEELFWGLGRLCVTLRRPAESLVLLTGRRAAEIHERCRAAESERSTGSVGREKQRAAGRH